MIMIIIKMTTTRCDDGHPLNYSNFDLLPPPHFYFVVVVVVVAPSIRICFNYSFSLSLMSFFLSFFFIISCLSFFYFYYYYCLSYPILFIFSFSRIIGYSVNLKNSIYKYRSSFIYLSYRHLLSLLFVSLFFRQQQKTTTTRKTFKYLY